MNMPLPEVDPADTVEVRIPAKAEWVAVARLAVSAVASRLDFSVEDIEDLKLAIAEACTICIRRAGDGDRIEIICDAGGDRINLSVRCGTTQRSLSVVDTDDKLGFVIIESLMDAVERRVDGTTAVIEMIKRAASVT